MLVIYTAEGRSTLKPGTICRDVYGNAWKKGTGSWVGTGDGPALFDDEDYTLMILWEPDE